MPSDHNLRERLGRADLRFLAICLAVLALTAWFSVRYFYRAFPEASIDFRVNREQSQELARRFLQSREFIVDSYQHASRFQYDDEAKTFLEREVGLEKANQLMGSKIRLWRWSNRWFRPLQKEEFTVDITPTGQLAGFSHCPEALMKSVPEQARNWLSSPAYTVARSGGLEFARPRCSPGRTEILYLARTIAHDARYRLGAVIGSTSAGSTST